MKKLKILNRGKAAEIWLYDDIGEDWFGGISAATFKDELKDLGGVETITLYINSAGGSVFEGISIYNQLVRHKATVNVEIDGIAASIASLIAMAGDTISIAENATMMLHKPYGAGFGTADDMRSAAEALDLIEGQLVDTYAKRSGMPADQVADLVSAETWLNAAQAVEMGLADQITAAKQMAAFVDLSKHPFKNAPAQLPGAVYTVKPTAGNHPGRQKYAKVLQIQQCQIDQLTK